MQQLGTGNKIGCDVDISGGDAYMAGRDVAHMSPARYEFPHAKGMILGIMLLVGVSFIKGGKVNKMQHVEGTEAKIYDLGKFEKHIQESKILLKNKRP